MQPSPHRREGAIHPKEVGRQSQDTHTHTHLRANSDSPVNPPKPGTHTRIKQRNYQKKKKKSSACVSVSHTVPRCCYWPHLACCCFSVPVITVVLVMTAAILRDTQCINRLRALIPEHNLLFHLQLEAASSITSRKKEKKQTPSCFSKIGLTVQHVWRSSFFQELAASGK